MKLLLIGAGSVGAYFCGRAASGGAVVEVLVRRNASEIREKGYDINSIAGDFIFHPAKVCKLIAATSGNAFFVVSSS